MEDHDLADYYVVLHNGEPCSPDPDPTIGLPPVMPDDTPAPLEYEEALALAWAVLDVAPSDHVEVLGYTEEGENILSLTVPRSRAEPHLNWSTLPKGPGPSRTVLYKLPNGDGTTRLFETTESGPPVLFRPWNGRKA